VGAGGGRGGEGLEEEGVVGDEGGREGGRGAGGGGRGRVEVEEGETTEREGGEGGP